MSSKIVAVIAIVVLIVIGLFALSQGNTEPSDQLVSLVSWSETVAQAKKRGVPILLLVEQKNCGFCQALKRDLIRPLANDPVYESRALFVSVLTDFDEPLLERNGAEVSGFEFAESFSASTTPTILFLDNGANEIQERVVGYLTTGEYKAALLDKIEASIRALEIRD